MSRKFAPWYTVERWQKPDTKDADVYEEMFGHRPHKMIYKSQDGSLFSKGHYRTKIRPNDLAPSFVPARIFKLFGYYDSSAIIGLSYSPNLWINHLFRDDILYLSFNNETVSKDDWESYDILLCGWDIVICLAALKTYSSVPTRKIGCIVEEVAEKVRLYRVKHPHEHDCIEENYFWDTLASYTQKFASGELLRPY